MELKFDWVSWGRWCHWRGRPIVPARSAQWKRSATIVTMKQIQFGAELDECSSCWPMPLWQLIGLGQSWPLVAVFTVSSMTPISRPSFQPGWRSCFRIFPTFSTRAWYGKLPIIVGNYLNIRILHFWWWNRRLKQLAIFRARPTWLIRQQFWRLMNFYIFAEFFTRAWYGKLPIKVGNYLNIRILIFWWWKRRWKKSKLFRRRLTQCV